MSRLFAPTHLGAIVLKHRVVHAPTTRLRALADETLSPMMVEYYRQRASAGGLIITESSNPSHDSRRYIGAPGIYTDAHVEGCRRITDAVHAKGGLIIMQIAHDGRQGHVDRPSSMPTRPTTSAGAARPANGLTIRYERRLDTHHAFTALACSLVCLRALSQGFRKAF